MPELPSLQHKKRENVDVPGALTRKNDSLAGALERPKKNHFL